MWISIIIYIYIYDPIFIQNSIYLFQYNCIILCLYVLNVKLKVAFWVLFRMKWNKNAVRVQNFIVILFEPRRSICISPSIYILRLLKGLNQPDFVSDHLFNVSYQIEAARNIFFLCFSNSDGQLFCRQNPLSHIYIAKLTHSLFIHAFAMSIAATNHSTSLWIKAEV